jgi:TPR repeat protein
MMSIRQIAETESQFAVRARGGVLTLVLVLAVLISAGPRAADGAEHQIGDYVTALRVIRPLAEEGDAYAQLAMGVMYFNGWLVPQDYVQARKWFNLAASRTPPGADHNEAVMGCDRTAAMMTPAQVDEAQRLTQEWFFDFERRHGVHS